MSAVQAGQQPSSSASTSSGPRIRNPPKIAAKPQKQQQQQQQQQKQRGVPASSAQPNRAKVLRKAHRIDRGSNAHDAVGPSSSAYLSIQERRRELLKERIMAIRQKRRELRLNAQAKAKAASMRKERQRKRTARIALGTEEHATGASTPLLRPRADKGKGREVPGQGTGTPTSAPPAMVSPTRRLYLRSEDSGAFQLASSSVLLVQNTPAPDPPDASKPAQQQQNPPAGQSQQPAQSAWQWSSAAPFSSFSAQPSSAPNPAETSPITAWPASSAPSASPAASPSTGGSSSATNAPSGSSASSTNSEASSSSSSSTVSSSSSALSSALTSTSSDASSSSAAAATASASTHDLSKTGSPPLAHNTPLLLVTIVGAVVLFATLLAGLAWLCRLHRGASRKRGRLAKWSPGGSSSVFSTDEQRDEGMTSATPVPPLHRSPSMSESSWQRGENGSAPYLEPVPNGRGWTLFDPPVPGADEEKGEKADAAGAQAQRRGGGGGNYNLAQNLDEAPPSPGASDPIWPPPARRPSFIERLLAQRPASTPLPPQLRPPSGADGAQAAFARGPYPTVCPLPAGYGFGTQTPVVSNSPPRRKSLFPIISLPYMLPSSLRNAAAARMNQNKPEAPDSDFEGTIGGRDNELPMAKRLGKKANRFRCDVSSSGEERSPLAAPQGTTQALDCTPGLAGVGSAWPRLPPLDPLEVPSEGVDALTAADGAGAPTPPAAAAVRGGQFVRPAHRLMGPRPATLPELQRQRAQEALRGPTDEEAFDFDPRDARAKLIASVTRWQARTQDAEPVPGSFASISGSSRACRRPAAKRTITSTSGASYVSEGTTMTGSSSCPGKEDIQNPYMGQTALSPVPSIRPQFAATTTLESWLADERGDDVDLLSPLQEGSEIRFGGTPLVHPQTSLPPGYRTNASDEDRPISSPLPPPRAARSRASTRSQTSATTSTAPTSIFDETPHMRRREERKRERSAQAALANQLWGVGSAHAEKERLAQEEEVRLHHTVLDMSEDVSSKQEKTSLAPPTTVVRSGSTGTNSVYSSITAPSEYCASLFATGAGPALPSPAARPQERSDAFRARTRVVSGTVPAAHVPTPRTVPVAHTPMSIDSPWTSSDSDVSARRWAGVARPRGSFIVERKKPKNRVVTQPAQMQMSTPLALPRQRAASHGTTTAQAQTTRRVPHHERAVAGAFVNVNLVEAGDSRGPRKTRAASGPVASAQKQEREQQKQRRGASKEEATEQTQSGNFSSSTAPLDVRKRNGPM